MGFKIKFGDIGWFTAKDYMFCYKKRRNAFRDIRIVKSITVNRKVLCTREKYCCRSVQDM